MFTGDSRRPIRRSAGLLAALALVVAACGGSDGGGDDGSGPDGDNGGDAVVITEPPDPNAAPTGENVPAPAQAADEPLPEQDAVDLGDDGPVAVMQQNGPVTVTGAILPPFDPSTADPTVGSAAPVVEGESFDGTAITIGAPTDNPTMIVFLAHWCPHCNDEIPEILSLYDEGLLPTNLDIVAVSTAVDETRENYPPSEWIVEKGWLFPTMADDTRLTAINAFGGTGFPYTAIVDSDGTVLARRGGSATAEQILEFVNSAVS